MRVGPLLISTLVVGGLAAAQGAERKPDKPRAPDRRSDVCAAYGPGFVKLQGTTTCVRVGGTAAGQLSVGSGTSNLGVK